MLLFEMRRENVFLRAPPDCAIAGAIDDVQLHDLVFQQPQCPACEALGRLASERSISLPLSVENPWNGRRRSDEPLLRFLNSRKRTGGNTCMPSGAADEAAVLRPPPPSLQHLPAALFTASFDCTEPAAPSRSAASLHPRSHSTCRWYHHRSMTLPQD